MSLSEALSFDDVLLRPRSSNIISRSEVDLAVKLSPTQELDIPIITSPMDTVTESAMAISMSKLGGLGIVHRYNTISTQIGIIRKIRAEIKEGNQIAAAIGVTGDFEERAQELHNAGVDILCIDVAHGHHVAMEAALNKLRKRFGGDKHLMAGNIATHYGFRDLAHWGASSVRVGIGGGSICSTRLKTGHGVPTWQSVRDCQEMRATLRHSNHPYADVKIIADGGIKNSGDIVKALAAGADMVMVGSLVAGTVETPGPVLKHKDGSDWKTYRGMASLQAQLNWRGKASSLEGVSTRVPITGPVESIIEDLVTGIRSGLSYSGARSINELQAVAEFIKQSSAGALESGTHIFERF